jgi:hypothetical protein
VASFADWGDAARERDRIVRDVLGTRYLAVLRAAQRAMPRPRQKGEPLGLRGRRRVLTRGESFDPGVFHGAIVIMDLESATAVCQANLDAESSDRLDGTCPASWLILSDGVPAPTW